MSEPSDFARDQLADRCERLCKMLRIGRYDPSSAQGATACDDPDVAAIADDDSLWDHADPLAPQTAPPRETPVPVDILDREVGLVSAAIDRWRAERKAGTN